MNPECYAPPALIAYLLHVVSPHPECDLLLSLPAQFQPTPVMIYLMLFFLTCLLESPFYLRAVDGKIRPFLSSVFLCNLATHPAVCFLIPFLVSLARGDFGTATAIGEVFAPLVEGLLLYSVWKLPFRRAMGFSIAANLFSWWIGVYTLPFLFPSY